MEVYILIFRMKVLKRMCRLRRNKQISTKSWGIPIFKSWKSKNHMLRTRMLTIDKGWELVGGGGGQRNQEKKGFQGRRNTLNQVFLTDLLRWDTEGTIGFCRWQNNCQGKYRNKIFLETVEEITNGKKDTARNKSRYL